MQPSSKEVVIQILRQEAPATVLDAPSGDGWLGAAMEPGCQIDGLDLYDSPPVGYRNFLQANLDAGLPDSLDTYTCICCCEGIEHFANPGLFFDHAFEKLEPGGLFLVTTPNVWYPEAKLQYLLRGFFPGFPCLIGRIERGSHMHIMPWSWPHLYLYLNLAGFVEIEHHEEPLSKPRHFWERLVALPQYLYCRSRARKATDAETKHFWEVAGSERSLCGRHLIISARKPR